MERDLEKNLSSELRKRLQIRNKVGDFPSNGDNGFKKDVFLDQVMILEEKIAWERGGESPESPKRAKINANNLPENKLCKDLQRIRENQRV